MKIAIVLRILSGLALVILMGDPSMSVAEELAPAPVAFASTDPPYVDPGCMKPPLDLLRRARVTSVTVIATVDADGGKPIASSLERPTGLVDVDEAILAAVSRCEFHPAELFTTAAGDYFLTKTFIPGTARVTVAWGAKQGGACLASYSPHFSDQGGVFTVHALRDASSNEISVSMVKALPVPGCAESGRFLRGAVVRNVQACDDNPEVGAAMTAGVVYEHVIRLTCSQR